MKSIKTAKRMFVIWIIHFVIYNTYFGWNQHPINEVEETWDLISMVWLYLSWSVYFIPTLDKYEKWISNK